MIVADTSPLIVLARIGYFELLRDLYGSVTIPVAVDEEITRHPRGFNGERPAWIMRVEVINQETLASVDEDLHPGEAQAITLALEMGSTLLIDERAGRRVARSRGLTIIGTVGVLAKAKQAGLIASFTEALPKLEAAGFYMSAELIFEGRHLAGES